MPVRFRFFLFKTSLKKQDSGLKDMTELNEVAMARVLSFLTLYEIRELCIVSKAYYELISNEYSYIWWTKRKKLIKYFGYTAHSRTDIIQYLKNVEIIPSKNLVATSCDSSKNVILRAKYLESSLRYIRYLPNPLPWILMLHRCAIWRIDSTSSFKSRSLTSYLTVDSLSIILKKISIGNDQETR